MKTFKQEILESFADLKEYAFVIGTIAVCIVLLCVVSVEMGYSMARRDAIVTGHAFWGSDKDGNPEFRWKEQEQVIGEYLGLNKK